MSFAQVSGWGIVSGAGVGRDAFAETLCRDVTSAVQEQVLGRALLPEEFPPNGGHFVAGFDAKALLGRKGTAFLDRRTGLTLVACREALQNSRLDINDHNRHRIGVMLGTTCGSLRSMCDFTRQTLDERKPYLVDPLHFPNTILNCAAGQTAIRFGLQGLNATLANGPLAFLTVLAYAQNALNLGYVDAIVAGAVEEFTAYDAWKTYLTSKARTPLPAGEAAAMFVLESPRISGRGQRDVIAEIQAVVIAFCPGGLESGLLQDSLRDCVRRAIAESTHEAQAIQLVLSGACEGSEADGAEGGLERGAVADVLGRQDFEHIKLPSHLGNCQAATGGLQLAALLCRGASANSDQLGLITNWTREGGVGAAVVKVHRNGNADLR